MRPAFAFLLCGLLPLTRSTRDEPVPVLVELFTSEGCSSCPPADAVLSRLIAHPEPGIQVVALGFHVDYWDRLGWKDPFSSATWTERQRTYALNEGTSGVYTPQIVVNGGPGVVGSDESVIRRQLREVLGKPRVAMALRWEGKRIHLSGAPAETSLQLWIAWSEEGLTSSVERGENAGRRLSHATVVRNLQRINTPSTSEAWHLELPSLPPAGTKGRPTRLVAFLQDPRSQVVRGVASLSL